MENDRTEMNKTHDPTSLQDELAQERTEMAQNRTDMAESRTNMAEQRTEMAQSRTDMAFERTAMSNSQTFLAYIRTAIAAFAAGIGMFEFVSHPLIIKIGIAFMAVAPVILAAGCAEFFAVRRKLKGWKKKDTE